MNNYYLRNNSLNRISSYNPNNIVRPANNFYNKNNINSRQLYNNNFYQNFSNEIEAGKNYPKDNMKNTNRFNGQYNINKNIYNFNQNNYLYNNIGLGDPNIRKEDEKNDFKINDNTKINAGQLYSKKSNSYANDINERNAEYHKRLNRGISHQVKKNNYLEGNDYRENNNPNNKFQKQNSRSPDYISYNKLENNSDQNKFISKKDVEIIKNNQKLEEYKSRHKRAQSYENNNNYNQNRQNRKEFNNQKDKINIYLNNDVENNIYSKKNYGHNYIHKNNNNQNNEIKNNNKRHNDKNENLFRVNNNLKQNMNRNQIVNNNISSFGEGKAEKEQFKINLLKNGIKQPVKIQNNIIPNKNEINNYDNSKNAHDILKKYISQDKNIDNLLDKNKVNSSKNNHMISQAYKKEKETNIMPNYKNNVNIPKRGFSEPKKNFKDNNILLNDYNGNKRQEENDTRKVLYYMNNDNDNNKARINRFKNDNRNENKVSSTNQRANAPNKNDNHANIKNDIHNEYQKYLNNENNNYYISTKVVLEKNNGQFNNNQYIYNNNNDETKKVVQHYLNEQKNNHNNQSFNNNINIIRANSDNNFNSNKRIMNNANNNKNGIINNMNNNNLNNNNMNNNNINNNNINNNNMNQNIQRQNNFNFSNQNNFDNQRNRFLSPQQNNKNINNNQINNVNNNINNNMNHNRGVSQGNMRWNINNGFNNNFNMNQNFNNNQNILGQNQIQNIRQFQPFNNMGIQQFRNNNFFPNNSPVLNNNFGQFGQFNRNPQNFNMNNNINKFFPIKNNNNEFFQNNNNFNNIGMNMNSNLNMMLKPNNIFNQNMGNNFINQFQNMNINRGNIGEIQKGNNPQKKRRAKSSPHIIIRITLPHANGLQNIGATCYMNATLQCLAHIKKFTYYLLENKDNIQKNRYKNKLSNAFIEVLENIWQKNYITYYAPNNFKNLISQMNPLFAGVQANDSKDLVLFILETMHNELNAAKKGKENNLGIIDQYDYEKSLQSFTKYFQENFKSIVSDIFYGMYNSIMKCHNCKVTTHNIQCFNILIMPLEEVRKFKYRSQNYVTIRECFEYYQKTDYMVGENQIYCNNCKRMSTSENNTTLIVGPKVLIINLNRGKGLQFDIKLLFDEQINISDFIYYKETNVNYKLIGVVTHFGPSGESGHFIAFCKSFSDPYNNWYKYNDAIVSLSSFKEAQNTGVPYILFYAAEEFRN